jgi:hypothetical protein
MAREQTFEQKLQPHVGGLVRVRYGAAGAIGEDLSGKIGLLMSVVGADGPGDPRRSAQIEVLIDGSVRSLIVYLHEIELIGADDV